MDAAMLTDLKQFITAAVAQAVAALPTKDDMNAKFATVDQRFNRLERRFDELEISMNTQFNAVAEEFTNLHGEIDGRFDKLQTEMNGRFDDLDAKVDTIADAHSEQLADHDRRIARLEKQHV